jgi:hypothetical protein
LLAVSRDFGRQSFEDCGWKSVETSAGSLEKASRRGVKTAVYEQSPDIPEPVEKKQWKTRGNRNKSSNRTEYSS